jgi:hypothetical protein
MFKLGSPHCLQCPRENSRVLLLGSRKRLAERGRFVKGQSEEQLSGLSKKTESCYAVNIMASKARLGTFDQLLAETNSSAEIHAIATKLREIILEVFPAAIEVVRLGEGTASYGVGEKKMSESHVYIMPKDTYVNLGFWHSTELHDPSHLLEGTGKKLRHVKVYTLELAQAPSIRALITNALEKRKQALAKK